MIRVLVMIAVTGFLVSVVTLSTAVAIGGPELITDAAWNGWSGKHFRWSHDWDDDRWSHRGGAEGKRELAWTGGDALTVDIPADVRYTQASGPAKLTITGPQRELDNLVLEDGHLRFAHGHRHWDDLVVVMTAPNVTRFDMSGSGRLAIEGYKQDKLIVDLSGDGSFDARGETKALELSISGSGESNLTDLKVGDAKVDIDGSGAATLAPTGAANVNISGSGEVTLLSRPAKLESNISGSGSIHQKDGASMAPQPPPEPSEPRPPKAPKPPRPV